MRSTAGPTTFPAMQRIDYAGSVHDEEEIAAVLDVLRGPATALRIGRNVKELERRVAATFAKRQGIMVNSGSSALYLAVELLEPEPGDEIITSAVTFSTDIAPMVRAGVHPVFVDVTPDTYQIDVEQIEGAISDRTTEGIQYLYLVARLDVDTAVAAELAFAVGLEGQAVLHMDPCISKGLAASRAPLQVAGGIKPAFGGLLPVENHRASGSSQPEGGAATFLSHQYPAFPEAVGNTQGGSIGGPFQTSGEHGLLAAQDTVHRGSARCAGASGHVAFGPPAQAKPPLTPSDDLRGRRTAGGCVLSLQSAFDACLRRIQNCGRKQKGRGCGASRQDHRDCRQ